MNVLTPDETILGLLAIEERHGYDLLECFQNPAELGRVWNLSASQIYNVLKRLEHKGHITGQVLQAVNAPPRTRYRVTTTGQQCLDAWLYDQQPSASIRRVRVEFLSRLYVVRYLNIPTQQIVQYQRAACEQQRALLYDKRQAAVPGMDTLALDFVIAQLDAVLRWIERCEMVPKG